MRVAKLGALLVVALLALGLGASLRAQTTDNNGNPVILDAVKAVQAAVGSLAGTVGGSISTTLANLVTTVNGLVTTVNTINTNVSTIGTAIAVGNTRFTPAVVAFAPDTFICTVTNVSSVSRTIRVELINGNTGASLAQNSPGGLAVAAGVSTAASFAATSTRAFCKVTVVDGVKTDVRGVLALFASGTASDKLVIEAE